GDAYALFVAAAADAAHHVVEVGQAAARGVGQPPPGRGQQHTAGMAVEQWRPQPALELAHVVADRAGGESELLRGMGEVLVAGRRLERGQRREPSRTQHGETPVILMAVGRSMRLCGLRGYGQWAEDDNEIEVCTCRSEERRIGVLRWSL